MAEAILSAQDCCEPCDETLVENLPGPPGDDGTDGSDGAPGENSYTTLTNPFTMPGEGDSDVADVVNSDWMAVGQKVFIGRPDGAARGTFEVVDKPDSISVELLNVEDAGTEAYLDNSPAGTVFAAASVVSPSGLQGPGGSVAGGALLAANQLNDITPPYSVVRSNLGLGSAAERVAGVANTNLAPVDDAGGLTSGEMLRATAAGIESVAAATARTALGLGSMAVQDAGAVNIGGGNAVFDGVGVATTGFTASGDSKVNGPLFTAPSTIQSLLAATAISPNRAKIRVVGNGGAVTLTATPTITTPSADGQLLLIMGTDDTNTVTLQDEAALAGTKLSLGAATRLLGAGDHLLLSWDTTTAMWWEVAFTNN